ncbi:TonB-dependent receptor [Penaeicola halotolerans]|uniref:TonB-dependent receptor n=1 Tax=Penaeicola halotolerans TaxID=2793196 RepID=UPI001CF8613E|nr:TonB-dependent receptor [Penaeicola halotolerans]
MLQTISFAKDDKPAIKGTILSVNQEPVAFANVMVEGTYKGAFTEEDGSFIIYDLPDGEYTVIISALGYKRITQKVTIKDGVAQNLNIAFEEEVTEIPQITVFANRDRMFTKVPGSAGYVSREELTKIKPISGNEALRRVAGVHVVDEEGLGMRVNIGIRGLDPDRSRSVLVMEDGVPVALAPYGEPEMYYSPAIDRMSGIEVLKGSGQILYGPQTIGGVINYLTANPPQEEEIKVRMQGGQGGFFSGLLSYGNTFGNSGIQVDYLRKQADEVGPTEFQINDFNVKFKQELTERSTLGLKLGVYNEVSNSTYIGLTQSMYDMGGMDFLRIAPDDQLDVKRFSGSATHEYKINDRVKLKTLAYAYTTTRNWRRQDFASTPPANPTGVVYGDTNIPGGAIYMRNSTGNRNRQFEVVGVEPRLEVQHDLFGFSNELQTGVRYLYEKAYEQRVNGTKFNVSSGNLVEDEVRTGNALSAYVQNKFNLSERFMVSAGVRVENFNYERDIFRRSFPGIGVRDTILVNNSSLTEVIPGLGFTYKVFDKTTVFGGVHRGFAPPRTKDAITSLGDALDLEAEKSWNYELGFRADVTSGVYAEITGFYMNFSNQVIPVSESSGGLGTGLVNGGATVHQGLEAALAVDFSKIFSWKKTSLIYDINASYVEATYSEDRFIDAGEDAPVNISGNFTPYAPQVFLSSALSVETLSGFGLRLTGTYVGDQFTDELNTVTPSANGQIGELPAYFTLDATASYFVEKWNTAFNVSVKNLTDERYISTRRPQGIRVGLPRFITAGFEIKF